MVCTLLRYIEQVTKYSTGMCRLYLDWSLTLYMSAGSSCVETTYMHDTTFFVLSFRCFPFTLFHLCAVTAASFGCASLSCADVLDL